MWPETPVASRNTNRRFPETVRSTEHRGFLPVASDPLSPSIKLRTGPAAPRKQAA